MAADPLTVGQVAFFLGLAPVLTAWMYAEVLCYARHRAPAKEHLDVGLVDLSPKDGEREQLLEAGGADGKSAAPAKAELSKSQGSRRFPIINETFLVDNRGTLRSIAEFAGLLFYFFLCDRTTVLGESEKSYNRDLFMFLYLLLVLYSATTSLKKHVEKSSAGSAKPVMFLNRHQTEEWKGWMQVLFLMYHYFNAREIYNAIRVFIAGYVWMTGFGNFSYYYVRKDFSLGRFAQMMWRLNFLVFFACLLLDNDYMLYYICPMHTLFTVMVYGMLGIAHKYNEVPAIMAAKFLAAFSVVVIVWEIPGVFEFLWWPLTFLLRYKDPRDTVEHSPLREWHFRSGLDRYVWIVGMLYAYFHPNVERWLEKWEELEYRARVGSKAVVLSVTLGVGYLWYEHVYRLDKKAYNRLHPYTSWIPISVFVVLRNFSQPLRSRSLSVFVWLGKITLETYIAQFHIWLRTGVSNGQPKMLLSVIPGYPLLNFTLTTAAYVLVSYRLFQLVNVLKLAFVPSSDNKRLFHMFVSGSIIALSLYGTSFLLVAVPKFLVWAV